MTKALSAGLAYFAIVFAAGFLFGVVRVVALTPLIGLFYAVLLELPFILAISWLASSVLCRLFSVPPHAGVRLTMGAVAFVLLMGAEAVLATVLGGVTLSSHLASMATPSGAAGLAGQIVFALIPLLQLLSGQYNGRAGGAGPA